MVVGMETVIFGLARVFQMCGEAIGSEFQVVHMPEEAYKVVDVNPRTLWSVLSGRVSGCRASRLFCRGSRSGHRALNRRAYGLNIRNELRVQGRVQAVCANRSAGRVEGVDDHAEDREPGSFDVGGLGADEGCHGLDSGFIGLGALQHWQTLVSTNLATFTVSLAAVARACSTLEINVLMFLISPPLTAGDAGCGFTQIEARLPRGTSSVR